MEVLDRMGLPGKYALLCCLGAAFGCWVVGLINPEQSLDYVSSMVGGAIGGGIVGWIRQRRNKTGGTGKSE